MWQYYKDELYSNYHIVSIDFDDNNTSVLFNFKEKLNSQASVNDTKDVEIMVPLKNMSSFFEIVKLIPLQSGLQIVLYHLILLKIKQQNLQ